MSLATDITSVKQLKAAVNGAKTIYVQIKFGVDEDWYKLAKSEVNQLLKTLDKDASPRDYEMFTGTFGSISADGKSVYLG